MPSKKMVPVASGKVELQPTNKEVEYIFKVLKACPERLQIDWDNLHATLGYANKKSAQVPLNNMGKRLGWLAYAEETAKTNAVAKTTTVKDVGRYNDTDGTVDDEDVSDHKGTSEERSITAVKRKTLPSSPGAGPVKRVRKAVSPIVAQDLGFVGSGDGGVVHGIHARDAATIYELEEGEIYEGPGGATPPEADY